MRTSGPLLFIAVMLACTKAPAPAPTPATTSKAASRCAEVAKRFVQYPDQMVEQEPQRLSGAFPRVAPARRDTAFTVSFVVDTLGKPVMATFTVSKHVGTRFATALRTSVTGWRYSPASAEGCLIRRKVSHTIGTAAPRRRRADARDAVHAPRTTHQSVSHAPRTTHQSVLHAPRITHQSF